MGLVHIKKCNSLGPKSGIHTLNPLVYPLSPLCLTASSTPTPTKPAGGEVSLLLSCEDLPTKKKSYLVT
ncbi:unnamed protein product [Microthlaspi erraticum]|uniref:Uncharacterized protein n=1 Tax=Microthlaspi erraticum TaxID=1685480 RepID=A0A6D2HS14_9BRAS|nr:unnamed protein product [Microthlaspi erraticum]